MGRTVPSASSQAAPMRTRKDVSSSDDHAEDGRLASWRNLYSLTESTSNSATVWGAPSSLASGLSSPVSRSIALTSRGAQW